MKTYIWLCACCWSGGTSDSQEGADAVAKAHLMDNHVERDMRAARALTGPAVQGWRVEAPPVIAESDPVL
jgi:hypothetical protein